MTLIARAIALLAICCMSPVHASAIPLGETVNVSGRYWAQVNLFANLAWYEIDEVCPSGICGEGKLNGHDMAGWIWASIDDVNELFNTYIGENRLSGPDYYEEVASDWAPRFIGDFNPIMTYPSHEVVHGWTAETHPVFSGNGRLAHIADVFDVDSRDYAITENHHVSGFSRDNTGAWFYIDIPAPHTAALVACALATLLGFSRSGRR